MNNNTIANIVADRLIETINTTGSLPWVKPWTMDKPSVKVLDGVTTVVVPVHAWSRTGVPYKGVNNLLLRRSGEYITFNQAKKEGGKVKKGAKSSVIVYWQMLKKELEDIDPATGEKKVVQIPMLKYYNVFHIDDVEGLEAKHHPEPVEVKIPKWHYEPVEGIDASSYNPAAESIIASYISRAATLGLEREGNSDRAYYSPYEDKVVVPNVTQFADIAEYYSTLFHELGHSTGHSTRLNRFTGTAANAAFGSEEYSREELVAEITAASMLSYLSLESGNSFRNSAAYVKSWSEHIKEDPMMFITAAARADKAIDLLLNVPC